MDVETARPVAHRFDRPIHSQRGGGQPYAKKNIICKFWLAGRCNRLPCAFIHSTGSNHISSKDVPAPSASIINKNTWRNPASSVFNRLTVPTNSVMTPEVDSDQSTAMKIRADGVVGSNAETVKNIHLAVASKKLPSLKIDTDQSVPKDMSTSAASNGSGFSMLSKLEGHTKAVSGVVHPSGSDKLFSASKDETLRVWDCHSGQCVCTVRVESEIQCLLSHGPWIFAGLRNAVKAWNIQSQSEQVLNGPNGLVHALASGDGMLFAGVEDGSILVWKSDFGPDCPEPKTALKGHDLSVLTLVVGAKRLYSGSKDSRICVWDLENLQCIEILTAHTDFVTSLICWGQYMMSGSLDNTLKVWSASESGKLNVVYEVKEGSGMITFRGIMDAENKPILLCSYKDKTVRLYDLPSFVERGRIFGQTEMETIETGWCGGLFFTGDAMGQLSIWRLDGEFKAPVSS